MRSKIHVTKVGHIEFGPKIDIDFNKIISVKIIK